MYEVPAAWHDDPEDPSPYRYWAGSQWTEHRAPKHVAAPPRHRGGVVTETWHLGTQTIGPLVGIAALYFVALLPAIIVVGVGAAQSLEPGFGEILDEMTANSWNPSSDPSDQAFQDSIRWSPTAFFWIATVAALLYTFPVSVLAYSTAIILLANRYKGGSVAFAGAWSMSLKRFKRHASISLLWTVCYLSVLGVVAGLWALSILITPFAYAVAVPLTIALIIYFYPFMWVALTSLYAGPPDHQPWRSVMALVQPRWTTVARPVLVINMVIVGINLTGTVLSLIPILGLVAGLAGSVAQWIAQHGSGIVIWDEIGGEFDPEIVEP